VRPSALAVLRFITSTEIKELMKTYVKYPPRKIQSESYTGPITISEYERLQCPGLASLRGIEATDGARKLR
jgi:hypothetical protein